MTTTEISCDEKTTLSGPVPAIVNDFSYDADSGRYTLVLKTQKSWADTCRRVDATLSDGSVLSAYVRLA